MLDLHRLRREAEAVRAALETRGAGTGAAIDRVLAIDADRRAAQEKADALRAERNTVSKEIGRLKGAAAKGDAAAGAEAEKIMARAASLVEEVKVLDARQAELEAELNALLLRIPNTPHPAVPRGATSEDNPVVDTWQAGEPELAARRPDPCKAHWDIAPALGVDFETGAKLGGSGFVLYRGQAARLQRALVNFMLDLHTKQHGYTEIQPPLLVRREVMTGTGQLPKFEEELYRTEPDDLFLVPTAEVPVTNILRETILDGADLPLAFAAYTPCFRREAGAAGKDTRGLVRLHQFDKVELVRVCREEDSDEEHKLLRWHSEQVLRRLGLPYRVVEICSGDIGFSAARTWDLEVFAPGAGRWLEVSSCSTFTDFQGRRAQIRYRAAPREGQKKGDTKVAHTLNSSGVAFPRVLAAILEWGQQADGTVRLPEALVPYMDGVGSLKP